MLIFLLINQLIYLHSNKSIPDQFNSLVMKVIANSHVKIPKKDREKSKYHGNYSFHNAHFTLLKDLTSLRTTDIKAIAFEKNFAAILKRKTFKIADGFVFLDLKTQQFYLMEETVAFDNKINIYKFRQIEMFQVFSDLEYKGKSPLLTFQEDFNWDTETDGPKFNTKEKLSTGAGTIFSVSCHSKVHFVSMKKAEIATDVTLNGKVGTGLKIMKTEPVRYKNISIVDNINRNIPGLFTSFTFMGLKFKFDVLLSSNFEYKFNAD